MSEKPTLVFLHGVGAGDPGDLWKNSLEIALTRLGYPTLSEVRIVAPKYAHALRGTDDRDELPPIRVAQPSRELAKRNRRAFERRTGAIELRLGRHDGGESSAANTIVVDFAMAFPQFKQATNYLTSRRIRAQVLERVLDKVPLDGDIVLVGHSLGSVVAADVIRRLSSRVKVTGMITIGSPLASGRFDVDDLRDELKDPPANLGWWVNFWNWHDPVAAKRGVSSVFPWMIDIRMQTGLHTHVHDAVDYLSNDAVAEAIGFALFGSRSTELARIERGVSISPDSTESIALLALRYAHLIRRNLADDQQDRYAGALRVVQGTAVEGLQARATSLGRQMPSDVAALVFDVADQHSEVPEPRPIGYFTKEEALVPLTVLVAENVIRPFEISISRDKRMAAMSELTAEMGLGTRFGADIFASAQEAHAVIVKERFSNWWKIGALSAGAAALILATGGLALAAAPGVAGAAAITSALAAFGPGGMIGGLITAGSLVGAGGGGIAFGLASTSTSAETLQIVVEQQLSTAILREKHGLEQDLGVWRNLVETEIEVRRQYERLDEFSDAGASSLKELNRKLSALERAIAHLRKLGFDSDAPLLAYDEL